MNRFFVPPGTVSDQPFELPAAIAHQVRRVLRLRDGDEVVLLEGDGFAVRCRLTDERGRLLPVERSAVQAEPRHRLTICQALLKGDHLEPVIRHGTEVGVARFRLIVTERTIARDLSQRRLERLRTIAREAAEQSERGAVPAVEAPVPLAGVIGPGSVLLFERHDGRRLRELGPPTSLIIGPEGGFTPAEVVDAERAGTAIAGLGPRILRSESVAVAAAAVVLSGTGDFA